MVETIKEAIDWIHSRLPFGMRPGLVRVETLLERLNHPEKNLSLIHIAGTNGKGSTTSYLRTMIQETGLKVGTYTSPYIEVFNERIAIDGTFITDEELVLWVNKIKPIVEEMDQEANIAGITEFEVLTALSLDYFLEKNVDVAIIEVGLGGTYDSTNVITPVLAGITTIGLDHTDILGDTIEEIAEQKAGIIKAQVPLVLGNIVPEAKGVIQKVADKQQTKTIAFGKEYEVTYRHPDKDWGEVFDYQDADGKLKNLVISLLGHHQVENAGMAIALFKQFCTQKGLRVQEKWIRDGLQQTFWPARMERIRMEPCVLLDGAHNEHAMKRLVENLTTEFKGRPITVLFSALETKEISGMLELLLSVPQLTIYLTSFDHEKALKLEKNYQRINEQRITVASSWIFGLGEILEKAETEEVILITGSLYFVSQIRQLLMKMQGDRHETV